MNVHIRYERPPVRVPNFDRISPSFRFYSSSSGPRIRPILTQSKPKAAARPPKLPTRELIEVGHKPQWPHPESAQVLKVMRRLGLTTAHRVLSARLYEITGFFTESQMREIAESLLCDGVTQSFRRGDEPAPISLADGPCWRIEVWRRCPPRDVLAESVRLGMEHLGLPRPHEVRVARLYRVTGKCPRGHLERVARRALSCGEESALLISEETA